MKATVLLTFVTFFATQIQAWSINGHLYVASIAERLLGIESPTSLEEAYKMLNHLDRYSKAPDAARNFTKNED